MLAVPLESTDERILGLIEQTPHEDDHRGCSGLCLSDMSWRRDAIEPRTGIKFPSVLDTSGLPEVLVGTGSRSMRIIKVKSLKVYAFGLYINPHSLCEKLGQKYASVPINELTNCPDFYHDLLSKRDSWIKGDNGTSGIGIRHPFDTVHTSEELLLKQQPHEHMHLEGDLRFPDLHRFQSGCFKPWKIPTPPIAASPNIEGMLRLRSPTNRILYPFRDGDGVEFPQQISEERDLLPFGIPPQPDVPNSTHTSWTPKTRDFSIMIPRKPIGPGESLFQRTISEPNIHAKT
ncbi:Fatty-acid-binding protein 2 [Acorus gramineus]|uniref:Fatty-acid-binding protein 2 n=1 Tax=Acorus gramineus TaxID=55184 RepID=A0AAV9BV81_ACOGR|nr:Fatty-acid-binding protein 2 [Acorus gramineus]